MENQLQANPDVLVIGAGVMGASAAHYLARAGAHVRLIEQFRIGHNRGSSHGESRIIRLAYPEPDYLALAKSAYALWRDLERESGATVYYKTGGLDFGVPEAETLIELARTYALNDIEHELVDANEMMHRYPQLKLPAHYTGLYQADYGMLHADRCVATLAAQARAHGAEICEEEPVLKIIVRADSVEVYTTKRVHHAARVVLCAGSWMRPLLQQIGIHLPLTVQNEQVVYMRTNQPENFAIGRFPIFIHRQPGTSSGGAGFPILGRNSPKFLYHAAGPRVEPDDVDRTPDAGLRERTRAFACSVVRGLTGEVDEAVACRYTMTPDEDFLIDRHPAYSHVILASPCSGHGFKFGSVVGSILADLALRGKTSHDISRFRLDRPALHNALRQ
ncbi:MAG: N-methyl-L-tryptophan oxidase [Chloroflexi bacterium]|nr:N-methyl-L-tryptophan oxidase [Chloroflexota bacterium]